MTILINLRIVGKANFEIEDVDLMAGYEFDLI
jgi:hypothetical protein